MKFTSTLLLATAASLVSADNWTKGGCYKSAGPLTKSGSDLFQSLGLCSGVAAGKSAKVLAMSGGDTCYYGNSLPSSGDKVDDGKCDKICQGWPDDNCGGDGYYRVYTKGNVASSDTGSSDSDSSSSDSSPSPTSTTSAAPISVVTSAGAEKTVVVTQADQSQAAATVQVTATHTPPPAENKDNGPNKGAIAAGVVVGVVGVAAIAGAIYLYMRSRKHKEEAAELQRQNSVAGLRSEKPPSTYSMPDSRLEPAYMRRMSDGSIADNQDYSRRILKVTNPDDR